jgi:hypothetical protein
MKKAFSLILTLLAACTVPVDNSDQERYKEVLNAMEVINSLAEKADHGDLNAAYAGRELCNNTFEIDQVDYPGLYLGKCGGFDALIIQNAIMSGEPDKISTALKWKKLDKYPKRKAFYVDIGKYRIQKRCAEPNAPASCQNKETMKEFGL